MTKLKALTIFGFLNGLGAVALQFSITVPARLAKGDSLIGALIYFFTFFTILTNLSVVLVYASELTKTSMLKTFRRHENRNMIAAFILIVMLVYHFMLRHHFQFQGWAVVADTGLHYIAPLTFLVWWTLIERHTLTEYKTIRLFLLPMIAYMIWVFGRGYLVNEYPYPFLDLTKLDGTQVALTVGALTILFALFIFLATELDRRIYHRRKR
jgi:hypothetical protein